MHVIFVIIRWLLLVEYSFKYSESIEYLAAHTSLRCVRCCVRYFAFERTRVIHIWKIIYLGFEKSQRSV